MGRHNELGLLGEEKAVAYLQEKGYTILERNYRFGRAEVDIIAGNAAHILFVEVKTRSSLKFGYPEDALNSRKQQLISKAASEYMYQHKLEIEIRFDVISILKLYDGSWQIEHLEDAFFNY